MTILHIGNKIINNVTKVDNTGIERELSNIKSKLSDLKYLKDVKEELHDINVSLAQIAYYTTPKEVREAREKEEIDNLTEFCLDYQTYVLKNMRHKDESIRPVASEALRRMVYNYIKETTERTPKWGERFENE